MSEITIDEQSYTDFDWFATDPEGNIYSFTSFGGMLPKSVAESREELREVVDFFDKCRSKIGTAIRNQRIEDYTTFQSKDEKERYFEESVSRSELGCFSFDKTIANNFNDCNYHLVTSPSWRLNIKSLPERIVNIIQKTELSDDIGHLELVDLNDFLEMPELLSDNLETTSQ